MNLKRFPALIGVFMLYLAVVFPAALQAADSAAMTIHVGKRVLVSDCSRLGINLGGDNYYSGAALVKKRVTENFEGTSYRQCHFGPLQDERGAATWFRVSEGWQQALIGGRYTILSGPAKGTSGTIVDITAKQIRHKEQSKDFSYFVFDKRVPAGPSNGGLLVERMLLDQGQFRQPHHFWNTEGNRLAKGDVPPGSFGFHAVVLSGGAKKGHLRFATHYQRYGETNGTWKIRFWTKRLTGAPKLTVRADRRWGEMKSVTLTDEWTQQELALRVGNVPEPKNAKDNPHLFFVFEAEGGEVLLDDVEVWMTGDTNPTVFRDDCVDVLQEFRPGVLRYLQTGGNTLDNCLQPPIRQHSFASSPGTKVGPRQRHSRSPYSLHEMYELCEYLECEPWYCLPGTLTQEEMRHFMEYVGAPADVGYGTLRAQLGHPRPWAEVFERIHVEFGNEAWNSAGPYQVGGFNGPDYWTDLIALAKRSPYYRSNVVFHAGGQAANAYLNRRIVRDVPNADRLALAPYVLQSLSKSEAARLNTDEKLFRWAFAWPLRRAFHEQGAMRLNYELAQSNNLELSVYEINHHITHGDAPLEPRNTLVTSIGGGLNVANTMLHQLKGFGARSQCLFSLVQHGYNAADIGHVRLWGTVLSMREGHRRFRPTFLACALANRVIDGDLVETTHMGANPTFSANGIFTRASGQETLRGLPCLHSFAFQDGDRRGLILINLDVNERHPVRLSLPESPASGTASCWLLEAETITTNNEFEQSTPQVAIRELALRSFPSGWEYDLPACSMLGLVWEVQAR